MRLPLATATEVRLCPQCDEELPSPRPARCPSCGLNLAAQKKAKARFFEIPVYLSFQKDELAKVPDRKPGQPLPAEMQKLFLEINDDMTAFVRGASADVLCAALFDAHLVLSQVLHAEIDGLALKRIVASGKAIGKLAETIDQYIRAGGSINDDRKSGEAGQVFAASDGLGGSTATAPQRRG